MIRISSEEFAARIEKIQAAMEVENLDTLLVYGDEYRREQLRYVCNFWPIFERGACVIPRHGSPIVVGAPEGEKYAREMCIWQDLRNVKDFACVSVPEEIDYPLATFSSFKEILGETLKGGKRLGLVGSWDIPHPIYERIQAAAGGAEIIPSDKILHQLRMVKSPAEIACLREAGRLACLGYEKLIAASVPGNTELMAAAAGEGPARAAGAETIVFMVYGAGSRSGTIIGRPTNRIIRDGDMVMAAMAVQYQGYIATVEYPFVAGCASDEAKYLLEALFKAANVQLGYLTDGAISGEMVKAVRNVFAEYGLSQYDIYPPMHGIGLAEAESPYPDINATYQFTEGMCVNSDISLFGHPAGSNRLEEGFVITANGPESLTPYIRELCEKQLISTDELSACEVTCA
ncbi:M24 family metallopeptidase [Planctomicrobium sp. SH661]|uniref:M24 family metallopeptidase n=1 Tax=Planctomicrobium sp. SH661 TaxID=3448124 RepID=UPI003F5C8305